VVTVAIFATFAVVAAFVAATFAAALTALATAAFTAAALTALATAAFVAALTTAFVAATFTAATLVTDRMTASSFEDEAVWAFRNRDRDAVATLEFIPSRAFWWWSGNAYATADFIAVRAMRWWNHSAVTPVEHVAGRAFGTVLVEACAAATGPSDATGPSHRASGSEHEKPYGENCDQALPHEKSLVL
jgi:hypothetical protein